VDEQLNTYLNWFKENEICEGDNPPVGILLCTGKNDELVRYAAVGDRMQSTFDNLFFMFFCVL